LEGLLILLISKIPPNLSDEVKRRRILVQTKKREGKKKAAFSDSFFCEEA